MTNVTRMVAERPPTSDFSPGRLGEGRDSHAASSSTTNPKIPNPNPITVTAMATSPSASRAMVEYTQAPFMAAPNPNRNPPSVVIVDNCQAPAGAGDVRDSRKNGIVMA